MSPQSRTVAKTLTKGSPEKVGMTATRLRNVASIAREWVGEGVAQTMEVLVARRGMIVLHEVCGRLTPAPD